MHTAEYQPLRRLFAKIVPSTMVKSAEDVVRIEAAALSALADRLAGSMAAEFEKALDLIGACTGRVVVTGMGKSGNIAQKIAATLSSTGTPALFMHPAEALHGDLGMVVRGDVVLALSASGETEEILKLLATLKRVGDALICMCCNLKSTLALASDAVLDCSVAEEACAFNLAPTASTTAMLALGDALAVAMAERKGFRMEDFGVLHPGGKLGKKLAKVSQLMRAGDAIPSVSPETPIADVIYEMSRKGLGITAVVHNGTLVGMISDGDLRRLLMKKGKDVMDMTAEACMNSSPRTISPGAFASTALNRLEEQKITSLAVVNESGSLVGILHLHDLWETELV